MTDLWTDLRTELEKILMGIRAELCVERFGDYEGYAEINKESKSEALTAILKLIEDRHVRIGMCRRNFTAQMNKEKLAEKDFVDWSFQKIITRDEFEKRLREYIADNFIPRYENEIFPKTMSGQYAWQQEQDYNAEQQAIADANAQAQAEVEAQQAKFDAEQTEATEYEQGIHD